MSLVSDQFVDELANACLSHLVNEPELLGEFMGQTGTNPDDLRQGLNQDITMGLFDFFSHTMNLQCSLFVLTRKSTQNSSCAPTTN